MVTAKKTPAKAPAKAAKAVKRVPTTKSIQKDIEPVYSMPQEVKEWIDRANSIMKHQAGKIEQLTAENKELKSYRRWAEHRILRSEGES
jgi:hypothetical protein